MRNNPTQLPQVSEVEEILKKEAQRDPAIGKETTHYPDFGVFKKWMEVIGVDANQLMTEPSWKKVIEIGIKIEEKVVEMTLNSKIREPFVDIVAYLGEEDELSPADLIFVFGSKSFLRMERAIELWKKGLAPKILVTGGSPHYQVGQSEALIYKEFGLSQGVPEEAIIVEPLSITIPDNVRRSLNLFEEIGQPYEKMILVNNWFAMRRSWTFMMKYLPSSYVALRVVSNVKDGGYFDPKKWWQNPNGVKVVFNEFVKMRVGELLNTC